jgi:DNA polymerase-3 subunit alpha
MKKKKLKPILGCELYICEHHSSIQTDQNSQLTHLVVLAKNLQGYKDLLKIVSKSNSKDCFYRKPRLSLPELRELNTGNLIGFSGHLGSHMSSCMFSDMKAAAKLKEESHIRGFLRENVVQHMEDMALTLIDVFGQPNFFLEIQLIDQDNLPINKIIAKGLRYLSKKLNIPCIGTPDSHYCRKTDAEDQRLLLCNAFHTTLSEVYTKIKNGEDAPLTSFFNSDNYHIPSYDEMRKGNTEGNTEEELENTNKIAEMCEIYDITLPPAIPTFKKLGDLTSIQYLRKEIREGFEKKRAKIEEVCRKKSITLDVYRDRYKYEESVIIEAGINLEHYFLIVQDIIKFAKSQGIMVGCGRGSSSGSLISFLLQIVSVDPIEYDLLFERFYNSSRRGSLPDVDSDVSGHRREEIFDYIKQEYGEDKVARIATFGKINAKSALKDVFRNNNISFDLSNIITKELVDESKISDQLQEIRDEGDDDYTPLDWNIDYNDKMKQWVTRNDDGELEGEYAPLFAQAIRLAGTNRSVGVHACGICVSEVPIVEVCPLIRAKNGELVVGYSKDIEKVSLVKIDILSLNTLDRLSIMSDLINGKEVEI